MAGVSVDELYQHDEVLSSEQGPKAVWSSYEKVLSAIVADGADDRSRTLALQLVGKHGMAVPELADQAVDALVNLCGNAAKARTLRVTAAGALGRFCRASALGSDLRRKIRAEASRLLQTSAAGDLLVERELMGAVETLDKLLAPPSTAAVAAPSVIKTKVAESKGNGAAGARGAAAAAGGVAEEKVADQGSRKGTGSVEIRTAAESPELASMLGPLEPLHTYLVTIFRSLNGDRRKSKKVADMQAELPGGRKVWEELLQGAKLENKFMLYPSQVKRLIVTLEDRMSDGCRRATSTSVKGSSKATVAADAATVGGGSGIGSAGSVGTGGCDGLRTSSNGGSDDLSDNGTTRLESKRNGEKKGSGKRERGAKALQLQRERGPYDVDHPEAQMETSQPSPFISIKNLPSKFSEDELLRLISDLMKRRVHRNELMVVHDSGGRDLAEAYVNVGQLQLSRHVINALSGAPFYGRKLVTGFSLGPCSDEVYLGNLNGLGEADIREALRERGGGEVETLDLRYSRINAASTDHAFVRFSSVDAARRVAESISRSNLVYGRALRTTYRKPFTPALAPSSSQASGLSSYSNQAPTHDAVKADMSDGSRKAAVSRQHRTASMEEDDEERGWVFHDLGREGERRPKIKPPVDSGNESPSKRRSFVTQPPAPSPLEHNPTSIHSTSSTVQRSPRRSPVKPRSRRSPSPARVSRHTQSSSRQRRRSASPQRRDGERRDGERGQAPVLLSEGSFHHPSPARRDNNEVLGHARHSGRSASPQRRDGGRRDGERGQAPVQLSGSSFRHPSPARRDNKPRLGHARHPERSASPQRRNSGRRDGERGQAPAQLSESSFRHPSPARRDDNERLGHARHPERSASPQRRNGGRRDGERGQAPAQLSESSLRHPSPARRDDNEELGQARHPDHRHRDGPPRSRPTRWDSADQPHPRQQVQQQKERPPPPLSPLQGPTTGFRSLAPLASPLPSPVPSPLASAAPRQRSPLPPYNDAGVSPLLAGNTHSPLRVPTPIPLPQTSTKEDVQMEQQEQPRPAPRYFSPVADTGDEAEQDDGSTPMNLDAQTAELPPLQLQTPAVKDQRQAVPRPLELDMSSVREQGQAAREGERHDSDPLSTSHPLDSTSMTGPSSLRSLTGDDGSVTKEDDGDDYDDRSDWGPPSSARRHLPPHADRESFDLSPPPRLSSSPSPRKVAQGNRQEQRRDRSRPRSRSRDRRQQHGRSGSARGAVRPLEERRERYERSPRKPRGRSPPRAPPPPRHGGATSWKPQQQPLPPQPMSRAPSSPQRRPTTIHNTRPRSDSRDNPQRGSPLRRNVQRGDRRNGGGGRGGVGRVLATDVRLERHQRGPVVRGERRDPPPRTLGGRTCSPPSVLAPSRDLNPRAPSQDINPREPAQRRRSPPPPPHAAARGAKGRGPVGRRQSPPRGTARDVNQCCAKPMEARRSPPTAVGRGPESRGQPVQRRSPSPGRARVGDGRVARDRKRSPSAALDERSPKRRQLSPQQQVLPPAAPRQQQQEQHQPPPPPQNAPRLAPPSSYSPPRTWDDSPSPLFHLSYSPPRMSTSPTKGSQRPAESITYPPSPVRGSRNRNQMDNAGSQVGGVPADRAQGRTGFAGRQRGGRREDPAQQKRVMSYSPDKLSRRPSPLSTGRVGSNEPHQRAPAPERHGRPCRHVSGPPLGPPPGWERPKITTELSGDQHGQHRRGPPSPQRGRHRNGQDAALRNQRTDRNYRPSGSPTGPRARDGASRNVERGTSPIRPAARAGRR